METYKLWDNEQLDFVTVDYYKPLKKSNDVAVVIFPGGGYGHLAPHEGEGYAQMLNVFGVSAFVVKYRLTPNHFPAQLQDARRAIRFVRSKAQEFEIDKQKVLVMGSSAGGHLAALVSTYLKDIDEPNDELLQQDFLPNGQILCYPVISSSEDIMHVGSYKNLLGEENLDKKDQVCPELLVNESTPPAFIWHTSTDYGVKCANSCRYVDKLTSFKIPCEMHIFPEGGHGLGVAPSYPYVSQWVTMLGGWIRKFYC